MCPFLESPSKPVYHQLMRKKGFTLAELIVVLVIMGLVAVMTVPRFATSPSLDAELQQLLGDLRYTQALALSHGQRFLVNFNLPSQYSITTTASVAVNNPSTGTAIVTLATGVTLSGLTNLPNHLIAFDENGIPYTDSAATVALASTATITLSNNGMTRTILITPETGSVFAQ